MANRRSAIKQTDATRLLKAAKAAGFARARLFTYPDGRADLVVEDGPVLAATAEESPFEQWKAQNAR